MIRTLSRSIGLFFVALSVVSVFTYWRLLLGFFEQDEWATFAMAIVYEHMSTAEKIRALFAPTGVFTHFTPVILSFVFYSFLTLGANYLFFAVFVLLLHSLNSMFFFYI